MLKSVSRKQFKKYWCMNNCILRPIFRQALFFYSCHDKHGGNTDVNIIFINVTPCFFDPFWNATTSHHLGEVSVSFLTQNAYEICAKEQLKET